MTPKGHPGGVVDVAYMREPFLRDGISLIDEDIGGQQWAVLPQLPQFFTDVELFVIHRSG